MNIRNMAKSVLCFYFLMFSMSNLSQADNNGIESLRQSGKAFSKIAKEASPSVVFIQIESSNDTLPGVTSPSPFGDEFFFMMSSLGAFSATHFVVLNIETKNVTARQYI